jgi:hypothetical protein
MSNQSIDWEIYSTDEPIQSEHTPLKCYGCEVASMVCSICDQPDIKCPGHFHRKKDNNSIKNIEAQLDDIDHKFHIQITSGSSGESMGRAQMRGLLGQQLVRIEPGQERILPEFRIDENISAIERINFDILQSPRGLSEHISHGLQNPKPNIESTEQQDLKPLLQTQFHDDSFGLRELFTESESDSEDLGLFDDWDPDFDSDSKFKTPCVSTGILIPPVISIPITPEYIKKMLDCICISAPKPLITKKEDTIFKMMSQNSGKLRFAEIQKLCKKINSNKKSASGSKRTINEVSPEKITSNKEMKLDLKRTFDEV